MYYDEIDTPLGTMTLAGDDAGLRELATASERVDTRCATGP